MKTVSDVVLSIVIMHHPARHAALPRLLAACGDLPVRVVLDPDPNGPPSPLRTAKRAWAAISDGATHHVVLQDDVIPVPGFERHLRRAVAARPDDGIALFTHWRSPQNAYLARRAAAVTAAWAATSPAEWTPTVGLCLPAAIAHDLADHLAPLSDLLLEDDNQISPFLAARAVKVVTAVPHLLQHATVPSLSGFDVEGPRYATVYDPEGQIPAGHWLRPQPPELTEPDGTAVELRDSTCLLRPLRAGTDEPVESPFGWYWADWAPLAGVDAETIVTEWESAWARPSTRWCHPDESVPEGVPPARLTLEVWAATYLLGAGLRPSPRPGTDLARRIRRRTVETWLEAGISDHDRATLTPQAVRALVHCGSDGLRAGLRLANSTEGVSRAG
jgi:hypothetical protein